MKGGKSKMKESEVYEYLKNTSFIDVIMSLINYSGNINNANDLDVFYTAKDLYRLYPNVFSKYKLDKFIKEENLPVVKNGKDRLFLKSDVENWLNNRSNNQYNWIDYEKSTITGTYFINTSRYI